MNRLPLRWLIPVLYGAILLAALGGGGALLYAQQQQFLYDDTAARLRDQARPIIDRRLAIDGPRGGQPPGGRDPQRQRGALISLADDLAGRDIGAAIYAPDATLIATSTRGLVLPTPGPSALASASRGLEGPFVGRDAAGGQMWVLIPVRGAPTEPVVAIAQLGTDLAPIDNALRTLAIALLLGVGGVLIVVTALGVTATRRALRPLERVIAASRQIAAGDLSQRVGRAGPAEIAELGGAFDSMVAQLDMSFAAQKRFVADAAHELRTPLTVLSGSIDLLRMGVADGDEAAADRLLGNLDVEVARLTRLTNDLLMLGALDARPTLALQPTDLSALLRDMAERYGPALAEHRFTIDVASGLRARVDEDRLRQIIVNLLDNARKHTPPGKDIALRAAAEGDRVRIEVRDEGAGIPPEALPHVFDRFYRADDARARAQGGSGLGLAIARAIAEAQHGTLTATSVVGGGSAFVLRLPRQTSV
ncbi:MAG: ATP-binding protein [Thermoflexales bacterium]